MPTRPETALCAWRVYIFFNILRLCMTLEQTNVIFNFSIFLKIINVQSLEPEE